MYCIKLPCLVKQLVSSLTVSFQRTGGVVGGGGPTCRSISPPETKAKGDGELLLESRLIRFSSELPRSQETFSVTALCFMEKKFPLHLSSSFRPIGVSEGQRPFVSTVVRKKNRIPYIYSTTYIKRWYKVSVSTTSRNQFLNRRKKVYS